MKLSNYQLTFKNIALSARFGFLKAEQEIFQRIYVDLNLDIRSKNKNFSDDLATVYDYSKVVSTLNGLISKRAYRLLEDLSSEIAKTFSSDLEINKLTVTIRKPSVPIDAVLDYVESSLTYTNE